MQETDQKSRTIALGLLLAAVLIFVGYFALAKTGVLKVPQSSTSVSQKGDVPGAPIGGPQAGRMGMAGGMGPGGGGHGPGCPTTQVGQALSADVLAGHGTLAKGGTGAQLNTVYPDGPGAKAGLKSGDIVAKCNDQETTCPQGLLKVLSAADPQKPVKLDIERKGKPMTLTVKPGLISLGAGPAMGPAIPTAKEALTPATKPVPQAPVGK